MTDFLVSYIWFIVRTTVLLLIGFAEFEMQTCYRQWSEDDHDVEKWSSLCSSCIFTWLNCHAI